MVAKKGKTAAKTLKNLTHKSVGEKQAKTVRGGIIVVCDKTSPLQKDPLQIETPPFPSGPALKQ